MASISSSLLPASALLTAPVVMNVSVPLANTEYTVTIPADARRFSLQARGQTTLQISDQPGQSNTTYFTLRQFNTYGVDSIKGSSTINLYVQSTKPNQVIEVEYWT
jgi:hypothetical protein